MEKKLKKLLVIRKKIEACSAELEKADVKKKKKLETKMVALINKSVEVIYSVE